MKRVCLLIFLLVGRAAHSQDIPKGAVAIRIKTPLSDSAAFEKAVALFNDKGYLVPDANYRARQIVTRNNAALGPYLMRILATTRDGSIDISGQASLQNPGTRHLNDPVVYDSDNRVDVMKKLFIELSSIATALTAQIDGATMNYVLPAKANKVTK